MKVQIVDITPAMAEQFLKNDTHNRPATPRTVEEYARDMAAGNWHTNGEAFQIAEDGTVLNGGHRFRAIVMSGVTLKDQVLVTGLPIAAQKTMDGGRKRNMTQDLQIMGVSNAGTCTGLTLRGWLWDKGDVKFTRTVRPTRLELDEYWVKNQSQIERAAEIARRVNNTFRPATATAVGTVHLITSRISVGDAAEFFAFLGSGAGLEEGNPILALRNRMVRDYTLKNHNTDYTKIHMILRAWNGWRDDETMSKIQFTPESLPIQPK